MWARRGIPAEAERANKKRDQRGTLLVGTCGEVSQDETDEDDGITSTEEKHAMGSHDMVPVDRGRLRRSRSRTTEQLIQGSFLSDDETLRRVSIPSLPSSEVESVTAGKHGGYTRMTINDRDRVGEIYDGNDPKDVGSAEAPVNSGGACVLGRHIGRGDVRPAAAAAGSGNGRTLWKWPSRRNLERSKSDRDGLSRRAASATTRSSSPSARLLRRRRRRSNDISVAAEDAAVAAGSATGASSMTMMRPQLSRLGRRRKPWSQRNEVLGDDHDIDDQDVGECLQQQTADQRSRMHISNSISCPKFDELDESAPSTAAGAEAFDQDLKLCPSRSFSGVAAASSPSASLSAVARRPSLNDSNTKPEHLVASMLLHQHNHSSHKVGAASGGISNSIQRQQQEQHVHPISPASSSASDNAPGWLERVGLAAGVPAGYSHGSSPSLCERRRSSPLGKINPPLSCVTTTEDVKDRGFSRADRDVPRFLRPVLVLLTLSLLAIVGNKVGRGIGMFGPAVHAAGGVQLPEAVVDDIFDRADKDRDGLIADDEIKYLVEGAGGALLDDASEIKAGVASVIKHLDRNADHALSRSDLLSYWGRLGTLLTVDEVAQWVVHAAQLPQEVADIFRSNMVTGYDFPELAAHQGALLEHDLGISRPAFRKRLVRSMKWKLWGMGEEPGAPEALRAANASCGALSLEWDVSERNLSFPVHTFVLRRAPLGPAREIDGEWVTVMEGPMRAFFDARLKPGRAYRYSLQAWNALGHSNWVEMDIVVGTLDCLPRGSWRRWWSGASGGWDEGDSLSLDGAFAMMLVATVAVMCFRTLSSRVASTGNRNGRRGDGVDVRGGGVGGGRDARRRPEALRSAAVAITGTFPSGTDGGSDDGHEGFVAASNASAGGGGSPMSTASSNGWSDRERNDRSQQQKKPPSQPRRRSSCVGASTTSSTSRSTLLGAGSKDRSMKRVCSDGMAGGGGGPVSSISGSGRGATGSGGGSGGGVHTSNAAVESMRKEAARRLMTRRSTSREEKEVCKECGKEWKWFRGKHTCCRCHDQFCDRKECGVAVHSFGACPVGGSCMCQTCFTDGCRGSM